MGSRTSPKSWVGLLSKQTTGLWGSGAEHILHAGDVFPVDLGDAPHFFAPGLQMVLRQPSTDGLRRQLFMVGEPDHLIGQQLKSPAGPSRWRLGAGGGHQKCLLLAR